MSFCSLSSKQSYNLTFCLSSVYWRALGYIIFLVIPSSVYTNKSEGFPTREKATYSCQCEKHEFSKLSLHNCIHCTCALFMVIAKASSTGNCRHLNSFKKCFNWLVPPDTKVDIGSGVGCNSRNFTFQPAQHIPGVSFLNFKALEYMHNLSIFSNNYTWI